MGHHSVAEAKDLLPDLIDRAIQGEGVVITREGRPVAELRAIRMPRRVITSADLDRLAERRRGRGRSSIEAGKLIETSRDEDWR